MSQNQFTFSSELNPNIPTHLQRSNVIQNDSHVIIRPKFNGDNVNYELSANLMDGRFNPLFTKTVLKNVTIDSRFRDNYYSSESTDFLVNLPIKIDKVLSMKLGDIELPLTYYNISRKLRNDYFWILINTDNELNNCPDKIGWYLIRVNEGNYTINEMITELNQQLTTADLQDSYEFKANRGKIIFEEKNTNSCDLKADIYFNLNQPTCNEIEILLTSKKPVKLPFTPSFDTTPLPLKLGWILGFRQGAYKNKSSSSSGFLTEGLFESLGSRYLFLVVDDFNNNVNNTYFSAFNSSVLNKNILARISLHNSSLSVQTNKNHPVVSTPRKYFGPIDIQKMKIQLLDEYGRVLDINNMDFSFSVIFECLYNN